MHHRLARLRRAVVAAGSISLTELAVMTALLAALAAVTYGRHVVGGGFYSDDWANAALYRFGESPRFFHAVDQFADYLGSRPVLAVLLAVPHPLLGDHLWAHHALALVLGVVSCLCCYLFLRAIPMARIHAGIIACLALVFPWADATRPWPTASLNTVALDFAFLGAFIALVGIRRDGRRSTVALAGSAALYALSVLTHEVVGIALLLVGALYLLNAPRSKALRWWAVHAAVVGAALVYTALTTEKAVGGLGSRLEDLPKYARQSVVLLSYSFVPPGTTSTAPRAAGICVVATIVLVAVWRYRKTRDRELGFWLLMVGGSAVTIASAYAVTLSAFLEPLREGVYNRGNLFAAFGYAGLVYALAMTAACLVDGRKQGVRAVAAGVVALIAVGYVVRSRDDVADWDRAARLQMPALTATVRAATMLPRGSTVFAFGHPGSLRDGIPIFYVDWDLDGALAMETNDRSLHAYPVYESASIVCDTSRVAITYIHSDSAAQAGYRSTYFLDVPTRAVRRISSVDDCADALRIFRPGPEYAEPEET